MAVQNQPKVLRKDLNLESDCANTPPGFYSKAVTKLSLSSEITRASMCEFIRRVRSQTSEIACKLTSPKLYGAQDKVVNKFASNTSLPPLLICLDVLSQHCWNYSSSVWMILAVSSGEVGLQHIHHFQTSAQNFLCFNWKDLLALGALLLGYKSVGWLFCVSSRSFSAKAQ